MITLSEKRADESYRVLFGPACLGVFEREVDGYYVFYPDTGNNGFWAAHVLRMIADKLDELNGVWDALVQKALANSSDIAEFLCLLQNPAQAKGKMCAQCGKGPCALVRQINDVVKMAGACAAQ